VDQTIIAGKNIRAPEIACRDQRKNGHGKAAGDQRRRQAF